MKKFLAAIDGYKRVIVIAVVLAQLWALQVFGVDVRPYTDGLFLVLGWGTPEQLTGIPTAVIATTVAGLVAIVDGVRKALAEARINRAIEAANAQRLARSRG